MENLKKILIVEGRTDRQKVERMLNEDFEIVCTHGTLGIERMEEMIDEYSLDDRDVYLLVDEDDAGKKLRKQLQHELPHAHHIFVDPGYREVAATPDHVLASVLVQANIKVKPFYLKG
ncbi:toprim domain protein [Melghiribacillus thermohalophilus]|uniref:Toprim domain protein n=1 Tax=Melghiribacillus thermohalophilus TaxID=1324956 RepID=A0A4R3MXV5_9BACI|nr:toprim domain-containing protein [Melghiribacillus thermohalophilus]TCT19109.1 toprim domain protein [Melghiribacillus thermohalophilus]